MEAAIFHRGKILHNTWVAAPCFLHRQPFPATIEFPLLLLIWRSETHAGSPTLSICQPPLWLTRGQLSNKRTCYLKKLNCKRVSQISPCYHNPETIILLNVYRHTNKASTEQKFWKHLMGSMRWVVHVVHVYPHTPLVFFCF